MAPAPIWLFYHRGWGGGDRGVRRGEEKGCRWKENELTGGVTVGLDPGRVEESVWRQCGPALESAGTEGTGPK